MAKLDYSTSQSTELARQARKMHELWKQEYVPLEKERISRVQDYGSDAQTDMVDARNVSQIRQQMPETTVSAGAAPSSGGLRNAISQAGLQSAEQYNAGLMESAQEGESRYFEGVNRLLKAGRGFGTSAMQSQAQQGEMEASLSMAKDQADETVDRAEASAIGSVVGSAVGYGGRKMMMDGFGGPDSDPGGQNNVDFSPLSDDNVEDFSSVTDSNVFSMGYNPDKDTGWDE